jgi:diacylglycerol kinase family enzyme
VHFIAVFNRDGGTLRTMDLDALCSTAQDIFSQHGHELTCKPVAGAEVEKCLREAVRTEGTDAILAAGGDGTISTAAAIAYKAAVPLGVLPAGTMNLFARALKIPLDLHEALESLAAGEFGAVDIATANDRLFVHQFGVGIHARLVKIRDEMTYASRVGKMVANLRAITQAAVDPPQFEAELWTAAGVTKQMVSGIAISNNPIGDGQIYADRLDTGRLGVYLASPMATSALLKLAVDVFMGTWRESPMITETEVETVTLSFPNHKRGAMAVIDGELTKLDKVVTLRNHRLGLRIVRPAVEAASSSLI